jgi:hypothetical protein
MTKVLITGYKHSGTTMLMSLLRSHPQVGWIEFEESYIEFDKPKEWVILMAKKKVENLKEKAWGEKIPWGDRPGDTNAARAVRFSKKWLKYFGKDAKILHIVRHPYDVASSGRPDGNIGQDTLQSILNSLPHYIDFINNNLQIATIVYEDLVMDPKKHLEKIFHFLKLNTNDKIINKVVNTELKFGKINADRAYAFRKTGVKEKINYKKIIKSIKKKI